MNAKRQTIWLVSMLSLMVVLSAYYLFTEDVNKLDLASADTAQNPQEVKIDMSQIDKSATTTEAGKTAASTADKTAADKTTTSSDAKNVTKTDAKTDAKVDSKTLTSSDISKNQTAADADAKVLQKMEDSKTVSASDYFTMEQLKNHEELRKKADQLLATITDPKQKPEAVVKAQNDLQIISGQQEKIDNLEGLLMKDYPQAVISQDGKKWKITVQSQKLEKSQGVTIVDMVMKELDAAPENIKIQYVQP